MSRKKSHSAVLVNKASAAHERVEESNRLDSIRPHVKTLSDLDWEIADYEAAQKELQAEGHDLEQSDLERLEQLRAEREAAQAALDEALAALSSDEEMARFLVIAKWELVVSDLKELADEQQPIFPTKSELQSVTHALLARVDNRLATQEDVDAMGNGKLVFCDCEEHVRDEAGELRTYTVQLPAREGQDPRTRKAVGSYFVCERYDAKKSIRNAVYLTLKAGNRHYSATKNASGENASRVLDREPGRYFVKVSQTFPARDGKPEQTVEDHVVLDVEDDGTIVFLESGRRIGGFLRNQVGSAWGKQEKVDGRLAYLLLDAAGRLSGNRTNGSRDNGHGFGVSGPQLEKLQALEAQLEAETNGRVPSGRKTRKTADEVEAKVEAEAKPKRGGRSTQSKGGAKRLSAEDFSDES